MRPAGSPHCPAPGLRTPLSGLLVLSLSSALCTQTSLWGGSLLLTCAHTLLRDAPTVSSKIVFLDLSRGSEEGQPPGGASLQTATRSHPLPITAKAAWPGTGHLGSNNGVVTC